MRNPAYQPSDHFHLLGLAELTFRLLALGYVFDHPDDRFRLSVRSANQRGSETHPSAACMIACIAEFNLVVIALAVDHVLKQGKVSGKVIRVSEFTERHAPG